MKKAQPEFLLLTINAKQVVMFYVSLCVFIQVSYQEFDYFRVLFTSEGEMKHGFMVQTSPVDGNFW